MLWVPDASVVLVQVAVRVSPLPARGLAEHPEIDVPPSTKLTVPVGAEPVTLAVSVTLAPSAAGLRELARLVVVPSALTTWVIAELLDAALPASPL